MSIQSGNLEEFLTVAEVAEVLKLNQQTVRNWIDQGSLPAHRVGRRVRIRRSDFDRLLEEGYTSRTPAPESSGAPPSAPVSSAASPSARQSSVVSAPTTTAPAPAPPPPDMGPTAEDFWGGEPVDPWDGDGP